MPDASGSGLGPSSGTINTATSTISEVTMPFKIHWNEVLTSQIIADWDLAEQQAGIDQSEMLGEKSWTGFLSRVPVRPA